MLSPSTITRSSLVVPTRLSKYPSQLVCVAERCLIWNRHTDQCVQTLQGHQGGVSCLQMDDKRIISGGKDKTVREWRTASLVADAPPEQRRLSIFRLLQPLT